MGKFDYKKEILVWLIMSIPFIYCCYLWNELPPQIATHFGAGGVDGTGTKDQIFIIPVMNICVYAASWTIPDAVSEKMGDSLFYKVRLLATFFFTGLNCLGIYLTKIMS